MRTRAWPRWAPTASVCQIVEVGAAIFFRHANAISAQRRQALVRLFRKVVLLVPARGIRPQLFFGKRAYRVAHHFLLRAKYQDASVQAWRDAAVSNQFQRNGSCFTTTNTQRSYAFLASGFAQRAD